MGPNTKILTKRDRALIWTPFDSSRKKKHYKIKNDRVKPNNVQAQKWYYLLLAILVLRYHDWQYYYWQYYYCRQYYYLLLAILVLAILLLTMLLLAILLLAILLFVIDNISTGDIITAGNIIICYWQY